ncbi:futalosine hydrolase [Cohnella hongkongensis]|uniref:Futalosine hydrolase n=1 Tax=Cohnella hongkongensis TaxID=178337 RepID=A0ABV9F8D2_9BACL
MTRKILIMTAVEAEKEAVLRGLSGEPGFEVAIAGVGPAAAAASTAAALARADGRYDLVVSAGIAGGFADVAPIGSIVVASESIAADLGAETPEGFASVDKLGFGTNRLPADAEIASRLAEALRRAGMPAHCGPVLTLSTVTGSAATAEALAARYPGAAAEAMEGFGVAEAARLFGLPFLEVRAISNAVGPRDRDAWKIGDALAALEAANTYLAEVLPS